MTSSYQKNLKIIIPPNNSYSCRHLTKNTTNKPTQSSSKIYTPPYSKSIHHPAISKRLINLQKINCGHTHNSLISRKQINTHHDLPKTSTQPNNSTTQRLYQLYQTDNPTLTHTRSQPFLQRNLKIHQNLTTKQPKKFAIYTSLLHNLESCPLHSKLAKMKVKIQHF